MHLIGSLECSGNFESLMTGGMLGSLVESIQSSRPTHARAGIRIYTFSSKFGKEPFHTISLHDLRCSGSRSRQTVMCSTLKNCMDSMKTAGKFEGSTLILYVNWLSMRRRRRVFQTAQIAF